MKNYNIAPLHCFWFPCWGCPNTLEAVRYCAWFKMFMDHEW